MLIMSASSMRRDKSPRTKALDVEDFDAALLRATSVGSDRRGDQSVRRHRRRQDRAEMSPVELDKPDASAQAPPPSTHSIPGSPSGGSRFFQNFRMPSTEEVRTKFVLRASADVDDASAHAVTCTLTSVSLCMKER